MLIGALLAVMVTPPAGSATPPRVTLSFAGQLQWVPVGNGSRLSTGFMERGVVEAQVGRAAKVRFSEVSATGATINAVDALWFDCAEAPPPTVSPLTSRSCRLLKTKAAASGAEVAYRPDPPLIGRYLTVMQRVTYTSTARSVVARWTSTQVYPVPTLAEARPSITTAQPGQLARFTVPPWQAPTGSQISRYTVGLYLCPTNQGDTSQSSLTTELGCSRFTRTDLPVAGPGSYQTTVPLPAEATGQWFYTSTYVTVSAPGFSGLIYLARSPGALIGGGTAPAPTPAPGATAPTTSTPGATPGATVPPTPAPTAAPTAGAPPPSSVRLATGQVLTMTGTPSVRPGQPATIALTLVPAAPAGVASISLRQWQGTTERRFAKYGRIPLVNGVAELDVPIRATVAPGDYTIVADYKIPSAGRVRVSVPLTVL